MRRAVNRPAVELPTALGPASLRGAVDLALRLIAFDLWRILEDPMVEEWGPKWTVDLAEQPEFPIHREDASTIVSLLLTRSPVARESVRDALDRSRWKAMYDHDSFRDIRRIRNEFAHPDGTSNELAWAENALSRLAKASHVGMLDAFADIQKLTAAVRSLKDGGRIPTRDDFDAAQAELRLAQKQIEEDRARAAEAEGQLEASKDERIRADVALQQAQDEVARLSESNFVAVRERERLEAALIAAREAEQAAAAEIARREAALARAEAERHETARRLEAAERELLATQAVASDAIGSSAAGAGSVAATTSSMSVQELADMVEELAATAGRLSGRAVTQQLPAPGSAWLFPRGDEVWRLSKQHRSLTRVDDETDLKSVVGQARAEELVDEFLGIRPTGGRVWVDTDGDAVTYADGRLVYLGRLRGKRGLEPSLQPGEPLGDFRGRGYALSPKGRIECRATGETLDQALGRERARAVAERILEIKPKGGRLKVSPEGVVGGYADRQWVFLTVLSPEEWFPGHLR